MSATHVAQFHWLNNEFGLILAVMLSSEDGKGTSADIFP